MNDLRRARQRQVARNEVRFREVNERMQDKTDTDPDSPDPLLFVCECGRETCTDLTRLTQAEYEDLRSDSRRFAVVAGHVFLEAESVVATTDRFQVVQKHEDAGDLAEAMDRRSD